MRGNRENGAPESVAMVAERSLLGALLKSPQAIRSIPELRPVDFELPKHGAIFRALDAVFEDTGDLDPVAILEQLNRVGAGVDRQDLLDLIEDVVHTASVEYHAELVQKAARRRNLRDVLGDLQAQLQEGESVDEVAAEAQARLLELAGPAGRGLQAVSPADVVDRWASKGPLRHEPTGISALDKLIGGGLPYGTRVFVAGAPDAGKTALLLQIADMYLSRGLTVGLLTASPRTRAPSRRTSALEPASSLGGCPQTGLTWPWPSSAKLGLSESAVGRAALSTTT